LSFFIFHLEGIKDVGQFQEEIGFNQIESRKWRSQLFWKGLEQFPSRLEQAKKLILQGRKVAVVFSLATFIVILFLAKLADQYWFGLIAVFLLAHNLLVFYYGRVAMTDSFQLFFFFLNFVLIFYYLRSFCQKNKRHLLILSLLIGLNTALAAGVKVIGILTLAFFLGVFFIVLFINNFKKSFFSKKLLIASLLIIVASFLIVFVVLNPQIYSNPFKGFLKMFLARWQSAKHFQKTKGKSVSGRIEAIKLIFKKLFLAENNFGNFGFVPFIPLDLIVLLAGVFLLVRKILDIFKKKNVFSLELLLLLWFFLTFTALIFYLKNDWPRYYLPLESAVILVQSYFISWGLKRLLTWGKEKYR